MKINELKILLNEFGEKVRFEHDLKKKNWFNIGGKTKVKNASFAIENVGETLCILGPSGIGKTTILRTIAGLEKIDKGKIVLENYFNGSSISDIYNIHSVTKSFISHSFILIYFLFRFNFFNLFLKLCKTMV